MEEVQYGVLSNCQDKPEKFTLIGSPVDDLDAALNNYRELKRFWKRNKFKLVRIEFKEIRVID